MGLFFIYIIVVLWWVDGPYLITPPSVNDKAAFHTHWAELCEIPCNLSTTKLGGLKPGEQGCIMATNEHHPQGSGHIKTNRQPWESSFACQEKRTNSCRKVLLKDAGRSIRTRSKDS